MMIHLHSMCLLTYMYMYTVQRLGELFRKLWNPRNFKAHVSPHEMLQAVASTSKKRFKITEQGSCPVYVLVYPYNMQRR